MSIVHRKSFVLSLFLCAAVGMLVMGGVQKSEPAYAKCNNSAWKSAKNQVKDAQKEMASGLKDLKKSLSKQNQANKKCLDKARKASKKLTDCQKKLSAEASTTVALESQSLLTDLPYAHIDLLSSLVAQEYNPCEDYPGSPSCCAYDPYDWSCDACNDKYCECGCYEGECEPCDACHNVFCDCGCTDGVCDECPPDPCEVDPDSCKDPCDDPNPPEYCNPPVDDCEGMTCDCGCTGGVCDECDECYRENPPQYCLDKCDREDPPASCFDCGDCEHYSKADGGCVADSSLGGSDVQNYIDSMLDQFKKVMDKAIKATEAGIQKYADKTRTCNAQMGTLGEQTRQCERMLKLQKQNKSKCGDGKKSGAEQCDMGKSKNGKNKGCTSNCTLQSGYKSCTKTKCTK